MEKEEKKPYPIKNIVNWYVANYCERKCFDKVERIMEHREKLLKFVEKNPKLQMTHRKFLELFNEHMMICTLEDSFKKRSVGWKMFEILQNTPNYNCDEIIVRNKIVMTKNGYLPKPVNSCIICERYNL